MHPVHHVTVDGETRFIITRGFWPNPKWEAQRFPFRLNQKTVAGGETLREVGDKLHRLLGSQPT
jgi:hypothetical protein